MEETNKKIDALQDDIRDISSKLENLQTFKASMIESSKWTSIIVSAVMGMIGFAVHLGVDYIKKG